MIPLPHPASSGGANIKMLFDFLDRTASIDGGIAECGVWRGRTLVAMGLYLKQHGSSKKLWGFDSFAGFDVDVPHNFQDSSLQLVQQKLSIFGLGNVRVVPGYFNASLPAVEHERFSFVHVDCDIHDSYVECLNFFYPRMNPGGVILFDEYADPEWPGATEAVDDFCGRHGIPIQSAMVDNYRKSFITGRVAEESAP